MMAIQRNQHFQVSIHIDIKAYSALMWISFCFVFKNRLDKVRLKLDRNNSLPPFPGHFTASGRERDIGEERKEEEVHLTANAVRA